MLEEKWFYMIHDHVMLSIYSTITPFIPIFLIIILSFTSYSSSSSSHMMYLFVILFSWLVSERMKICMWSIHMYVRYIQKKLIKRSTKKYSVCVNEMRCKQMEMYVEKYRIVKVLWRNLINYDTYMNTIPIYTRQGTIYMKSLYIR